MTADATALQVAPTEHEGEVGHGQGGIDTAMLGMLLFIGSEVMFFAGLFAAYFNARAQAPVWPPEGMEHILNPFPSEPIPYLPIIATTVLIISSFTMQWALRRIGRGDRTGMNRALIVTLVLGIIFLSAQVFDYISLLDREGFGINSGIYGTLFYTMTGFHGAHVVGGVIGIAVVLVRGLNGQFSAKHHVAVEAVSAYWHFVDIVWIFLFFTLYFLK